MNSPTSMQRIRLATWILSAALAIVFGWFGIEKILVPAAWTGFVPAWMDGLLGMPVDVWLKIIGAGEILFAVLLLIPIRNVRRTGAILIAIQLLSILPIAFATDFNLTLRDFAMMMSAIALAVLL